MVAAFTACSDDDDPGYRLPQNLDGLNVSTISNGNTLSGVQTTYALGADGKTVTLTMRGTAAGSKAAEVPTIDPGYILPGCAEVTLTFTPKVEATYATGEGSGVSTFCTYNYRVTMTDASVTVEFKDIVMNNGLILSEITYTDADVDHMLELTYNGTPVIGKQVTYTPKSNDWDKATITLSGSTLDLTEMLETLGTSIPLDLSKLSSIPTAGVLPGTTTYSIEVTINNGEFSGQGETEYLTFKYNGIASASKMEFNITEATLKNTSLAGNWAVPTYYYDDDEWEMVGTNPVKFEWESSKNIEVIPGLGMPPATIIGIMLQMGIIPTEDGSQPIYVMLQRAIKNIAFQPDGNIVASYVPDATVGGTAVDSPLNLAQYVVTSDNQMLLFLNPQAIIMNVMAQGSKSRANGNLDLSQFQGIIDGLAPTLLNLIQNGAPLAYAKSTDGNDLTVYLDTNFLLPLLKAIAPVFNNEDVVNAIINIAGQNEDFASMASMLGPILKDLPAVIDGTTKIEIGLNLTKAAN